MKQENNMLENMLCKSVLSLALSLAVVGVAGAGDDYSKKGKDFDKKEFKKDVDKKDNHKKDVDKKDHGKKKYDDNMAYEDSYDPSYDDPKKDNVKFDCPKDKKFPADNHKLCDKLGGDFLQIGPVKKCVIDKDPFHVACKSPKKYPAEADISADTKVFIRINNICLAKKVPGRIVACFDSHGKPAHPRKCEDKGCFPDGDHDYDDGYGGYNPDYVSEYKSRY